MNRLRYQALQRPRPHTHAFHRFYRTDTRYTALSARLKNAKETILLDGAVGSELQRRGADITGHSAWVALATERNPDILRRLHLDSIAAGAQIITANTFACTREMLAPLGLGDKFEHLNRQAVRLAVQAREESGVDVLVAGSISSCRVGEVSSFTPRSSDVATFMADCEEMAIIHRDAGADLVLGEMLGDPVFSPALIHGVRATGLPMWVGLSAKRQSEDADFTVFTVPPVALRDALPPIAAAARETGCDVMGFMHTKAEIIPALLAALKGEWSGPMMVYPDCLPMSAAKTSMVNLREDRQLVDHQGEFEFVQDCCKWRQEHGVQILGGCCGVPPSFITKLNEAMNP